METYYLIIKKYQEKDPILEETIKKRRILETKQGQYIIKGNIPKVRGIKGLVKKLIENNIRRITIEIKNKKDY